MVPVRHLVVGGPPGSGHTINISEEGAGLVLNSKGAAPPFLIVDLFLDGKVVRARCERRWERRRPGGVELGVSFKPLEPDDAEHLRRWLMEKSLSVYGLIS
ncbi:MAG: PilZ domain-containing protein [Candidatus Eremiobacteraeota bacterium]|nr:PilZ domain-containing protein [Candidatus Eremiobacteraeota bacterium]